MLFRYAYISNLFACHAILCAHFARPVHCIEDQSLSLRAVQNPSFTQGWTPQPNGRGTFDILWSCVFTIFLCSWSVLCLNVPALGESSWSLMRRKLYLTLLGIAGPEFTLMLALGQWASARRSVQEFQASGYSDWTMNQAFFADMGGFVFHSRNWPPFPIDAKQLHYLVIRGHVRYPAHYDKRAISDRNKSDGLVRFLTVCQTLWFTLNTLARADQHMAITTLELTTLAFIFCTLGTTFFWFHKPCDIELPVVIETDVSMTQILREAGDAAKEPYRRTPLDFISRKEWSWSLYWSHWRNILRRMHIIFAPKVRPINRLPNDEFPVLSHWALLTFFLFSVAYGAIFLSSWNFHFASQTERLLWRVSITMSMTAICACWLVDTVVFRILPMVRQRYSRSSGNLEDVEMFSNRRQWYRLPHSPQGRLHKIAAKMRNNSPDKDPLYNVPLKALIPVTITGVVYALSRAYILVEDFAALRQLPSTAYNTVNWSAILPHF